MRKIFSRKWLGALISSIVISIGIVWACAGGWDEDEYGQSNFTPETFVDTAYSPFLYSSMFYYKIGHDENQNERFNGENVKDWSDFLKGQPGADAIAFLQQNASVNTIDSAFQFVKGKSIVPQIMQQYGLPKHKNNPQLLAFLQYLRYAKKSEAFALNDNSWWNNEPDKKKTVSYDVNAFNRDLQNEFNKAGDTFLKQRYWFQLERSYFFNGNPQQVIDLFNAHEKSMPRNTLYYRALSYYAGAYYKLKDFSRANYYYSLVYDASDKLKTVAHYSFHPQEEKDWKETLSMCQNKDEQATLWQMLGVFYADEKRAMNEIYKLNPKSEKLELLLARAVNKYEQTFGGNEVPYDMPVDTSSGSGAYLFTMVNKIAEAGNTRQPWIWYMAAGYLNTIGEKYATADNLYIKAGKTTPAKTLPQAQLRLLKMINNIGSITRINTKKENEILADIKWLRNFDAASAPDFRHNDAFEWVKRVMASKYKQQQEWVKSECFATNNNFYFDDRKIEAFKTFLAKSNKTPYEQMLESLSVKKMDDLLSFQAIQLTYADKIDAAIAMMEKSTTASATVLLGNPFNGKIQDCHDCDHQAVQKVKYSKLSFLKKLKELKDKATGGEDVYNNASLLANAFYNISHFGNARIFYECKVLGEGHSTPYFIDSVFQPMLTGNETASKYYHLALNAAKTDEQKAKCFYMLAKCQRNKWYTDHIYNNEEYRYSDAMVDLKALSGFASLQQYSNTQYYKDVIRECGYFRSYSKK